MATPAGLLQTFPAIYELYRQGQIKSESVIGQQIMHMARAYARRHGLIFSGTLDGAMKIAEEADRTIREAAEVQRKRKGKRGRYDDIPRVN